jgi:hypothetical protein
VNPFPQCVAKVLLQYAKFHGRKYIRVIALR